MVKKDNNLISIVVPSYNEEGNIEVLSAEIAKQLTGLNYEVIFIDDGSRDNTLEKIKAVSKNDKRLHYISFSRNFGHQAALRAGLQYAEGAAVISMDADMQHPPALLKKLIEEWQIGYDVVYTRRRDSKEETPWFKRTTSKLFYDLLNRLSGLELEYGAADFRLLDRKVVDVIRRLPERDLFLRGFIAWCGFNSLAIDYQPSKRFAGKSKYSFKKMFTMAIQGITQFSVRPLHFTTFFGFISAVLGIGYGVFVVIDYVINRPPVSGWTSVIISVLVLGGLQLIMLGILGEYLGQTFLQTKQRPDYLVADSDLSAEDRR